MVSGDIILRDFTVVFPDLFSQAVHYIGFLQQGIADVTLMDMATDCSHLLAEYPEKICQDQFYRICRISKQKATWLLENGYIPCEDTGKKTHRFKIRITDVIEYLTRLEDSPESLLTLPEFFQAE